MTTGARKVVVHTAGHPGFPAKKWGVVTNAIRDPCYNSVMDTTPHRRAFLQQSGLVVIGVAAGSALAQAPETSASPATPANPAAPAKPSSWPGFPQQDPALAREIVGASHRNFERVKALLKAHPALSNAAYDWGFGDWETALGAASHVGNPEIAGLLLDHGARLDIFAATMLGMTDAVKAMLTARPALARVRGPHGITLLAHAEAGGHAATIEFVKSVDGTSATPATPLTPDEMKPYLGTFTRDDLSQGIIIADSRGRLTIKEEGGSDRILTRTGEHTFHPAGAPNVRIAFTVQDGRATRLELSEELWFVSATR